MTSSSLSVYFVRYAQLDWTVRHLECWKPIIRGLYGVRNVFVCDWLIVEHSRKLCVFRRNGMTLLAQCALY